MLGILGFGQDRRCTRRGEVRCTGKERLGLWTERDCAGRVVTTDGGTTARHSAARRDAIDAGTVRHTAHGGMEEDGQVQRACCAPRRHVQIRPGSATPLTHSGDKLEYRVDSDKGSGSTAAYPPAGPATRSTPARTARSTQGTR